jgi:ribonuclease HIII
VVNPHTAVIGVDESGKGDFFGPLVVAAFAASDTDRASLEFLGVRDSKKIAVKRLRNIASTLRKDFPHSLVVIGPRKYNELHAKLKNLNRLLAWGHARAIENLLEKTTAEKAISDKFGKPELIERALMEKGRQIELIQQVRGEEIIQVAAASILARAEFIRRMEELSDQLGMTLPRGAGAIVDRAGRQLVAKQGIKVLDEAAKTHFKNYQRVCNPTLFSK